MSKFVVTLDYQHGDTDEDPSFPSRVVGIFDNLTTACREGRKQEIVDNWKIIPRTQKPHRYLRQYNKIDTMNGKELDDMDDLREEYLALTDESYAYQPRGFRLSIRPVKDNTREVDVNEKEFMVYLLK